MSLNNDDYVQYGGVPVPAVFHFWVDNADSFYGYKNQLYQNIRIEGNVASPLLEMKNIVYPSSSWGSINYTPPRGNTYNITFRNIYLSFVENVRNELIVKRQLTATDKGFVVALRRGWNFL